MRFSLILFLIGTLGFVLNKKNIILMLISIEIMLLSITFLILISSLNFDDILGQTFSVYIIAIAGAESAIGLGILVAFYRLTNSPNTNIRSNYYYSQLNRLPITLNNFNQRRNYSNVRKIGLNPSFITGFSDAESSFVVTILKNPRYKTGWNVQARFQIKLHEKDRALLLLIQDYFDNIGYISKINERSTVEFRVSDITSLNNIIIPHFMKYTLLTNKYKDFIIFKQIVILMSENKHTTLEGLNEILEYKASLNWGLSKTLKESFPSVIPVEKVKIENNSISSYWLAGFSSGESNFFIAISGKKVYLRFSVAQDYRDVILLNCLIEQFNCGYVAQYKNRKVCEFIVTKIKDIVLYVIPFFDKYEIKGSKHKDYLKFKEAATIINNKKHLTDSGFNRIVELKKSMNKKN